MLRTLSFFVYSLLVIAATGITIVCAAQERQIGGVGITVFAEQNFRGKSATFRDDVPNLDPIGLNDQVSSLRVGPGERWEICEHADYQGRCVVIWGNESDLRRNAWNDLISSVRRIGGGTVPPPPSQGDAYLVLFDRTNYRGTPANYNVPKPDLYLYNRRAESVTIGKGVWELCEGRNYTGRCVTLVSKRTRSQNIKLPQSCFICSTYWIEAVAPTHRLVYRPFRPCQLSRESHELPA